MQVSEVSKILGGRNALRGDIASRMDVIRLSRKGITKDALLRLANYLCMSIRQVAELRALQAR